MGPDPRISRFYPTHAPGNGPPVTHALDSATRGCHGVQLIHGRQFPRRKIIARIEQVTGGLVTYQDICAPFERRDGD